MKHFRSTFYTAGLNQNAFSQCTFYLCRRTDHSKLASQHFIVQNPALFFKSFFSISSIIQKNVAKRCQFRNIVIFHRSKLVNSAAKPILFLKVSSTFGETYYIIIYYTHYNIDEIYFSENKKNIALFTSSVENNLLVK